MQQSWPPSIEQLGTFLAVNALGSFVAAARQLGCDPTVVSRRIQALESRLGAVLFHRNTRTMVLTEAGVAYRDALQPLFDQLARAGDTAAAFAHGPPQGALRLALPGAYGRLRIAPHLPDFLRRYPQIRVEASFSNRFVDLIGEGFDAAVRLGVAPDTRLSVRQIGTRERLLCAAPDYLAGRGHPDTPEALAEHDCLLFAGLARPLQWRLARHGETRNVPVAGRLLSDDAEALREAALAGLGILLATDWLVADALEAGDLIRVLPDWRPEDEGAIHLLTAARPRLPAKTVVFSEWITALLRRPDGQLPEA